MVRKAPTVFENTPRDSDDYEYSNDAFMEKSYEEVEEEVTYSDHKQNLCSYSVRKLRGLSTVFIDSIIRVNY